MIDRINIFEIIRDHWKTLRVLGCKRKRKYIVTCMPFKDWLFFIIMPVGIGTFFYFMKPVRFINVSSEILTFVSILGGFLLNLLALSAQFIDKAKEKINLLKNIEISKEQKERNKLRETFSKELHSNTAYSIIISIISAIVLVAIKYQDNYTSICDLDSLIGLRIAIALIAALVVHFIITVIMVLYRVYIVLNTNYLEYDTANNYEQSQGDTKEGGE